MNAQMMNQTKITTDWLETSEAGNDHPDWLEAYCQTAADIFAKTGMPTPADEDWKYTSLRGLEKYDWQVGVQKCVCEMPTLPEKINPDAKRIIFLNGRYSEAASDAIEHITVQTLSSVLKDQPGLVKEHMVQLGKLEATPILSLNSTHIAEGYVVHVAKGQEAETPIEILHMHQVAEGAAEHYHHRHVIVMEANTHATLYERHVGQGVYMANHASHVFLERDASLQHIRLQDEGKEAYHFTHMTVRTSENASYKAFNACFGAALSRYEVNGELIGSQSCINISGIYLLKGTQHADHKLHIDHFEPSCNSMQHFKGVLDDQSRAVFQGKVHVHRHAQKSDGRQLNNALLLSREAEINAKPELEIYADDVSCAHGATSGELDSEALFYLRARGIPEQRAKALLVKSYISQAIHDIEDETALHYIDAMAENWLEHV